MNKRFDIHRVVETDATPEQVWDAVTAGTGGWLWPMEFEPRLGGEAAFGGTVTAWDPPHHFRTHVDGPDGFSNTLDDVIEGRDRTVLRYTHSGIITDDWDNQYDAANRHTDFYLHTLLQYLKHFPGRPATYVSADGPGSSQQPDALEILLASLGARRGSVGDPVTIPVPTVGATAGTIDYLTDNFLGIRTADALYRFFDRSAWGAVVSLSVHAFGTDVGQEGAGSAWTAWLEEQYATATVS